MSTCQAVVFKIPPLKCCTVALQELADMNQRYEAKFGHIFIICASGKSAQEMLTVLKQRQASPPKFLMHGGKVWRCTTAPWPSPLPPFYSAPTQGPGAICPWPHLQDFNTMLGCYRQETATRAGTAMSRMLN